MKKTLGVWGALFPNVLFPSVVAVALVVLLQALHPSSAHAQGCPPEEVFCDLVVQSTIEQPDLNRAVDVVLVGDGFTDMAQWRAVAQEVVDTLRAQRRTTIYGAEVYNFHVVEVVSATTDVGDDDPGDTALGMRSYGSTIISAQQDKVGLAASFAPDVDVTVAVSNTYGGRANANFPSSFLSGGSIRISRDLAPLSHEFGHALFRLGDEYIEASNCSTSVEHQIVELRNATTDPTCERFDTTPGAGCFEGNNYCRTRVYRAASDCLMRNTGDTAPCPVCARAISEQLLRRRTRLDLSEPWAAVLSPSKDQVVRGTLNLSAKVWDDFVSGARVSFEVDGAYVGSAEERLGGATLALDTRGLTEGDHTVRVVVEDAAGHVRRGGAVRFVVRNQAQDALRVQVLAPGQGATVSGVVNLSASVQGSNGALWPVEVFAAYVDGAPLTTTSNSTLAYAWDTSLVAPGPHTLTFKARDYASNAVQSAPRAVTVAPGVNPQRFVFLAEPEAWAEVGPAFVLRATVGGQGFEGVPELWMDGALLDADPWEGGWSEAGGAALVDASGWSLGPHQLQLRARLTNGASVVSSWVPVSRAAPRRLRVEAALVDAQVSGVVEVPVVAVGPARVTRVEWHDAQAGLLAELAPVEGAASVLEWDSSRGPQGCRSLYAMAEDEAGARVPSTPQTVCISQAPASLSLDQPSEGARVAQGPLWVRGRFGFGAGARGVVAVELWVDGARVARQAGATGDFEVALGAELVGEGEHALELVALDARGWRLSSGVRRVWVERCGSQAACDDGDPCTEDRCSTSGLCVQARSPGCCADDAGCEDGDPCTLDRCAGGTCSRAPVAGCCNHALPCEDGDPCTADRCSGPGGECVYGFAGCCEGVGECDDQDPATSEVCLGELGLCAYSAPSEGGPQGCAVDLDCDDGDGCTLDECTQAGCTHAPLEACCASDAQCEDGDPCTQDLCAQGRCLFVPDGACCTSDEQCAGRDPCAVGVCREGACTFFPDEACCNFDSDCEDGRACTQDRCQQGACVRVDACCSSDGDCDDGDACTTDTCAQGECSFAAISGCCQDAADCEDGDPCTTDACEGGRCAQQRLEGCCDVDGDCEDGDVCTVGACVEGSCQQAERPACCRDDVACDDGDVCTQDRCEGGACASSPIEGCCAQDGDCEDGDLCTVGACVGGACRQARVEGCCFVDAECEDADPCTQDRCEAQRCVHPPLVGCCAQDGDCADDGDACTRARCVERVCEPEPIEGCCAQDGDCDDRDACTLERCADGACVSSSAGCCAQDGDCDDGDPCTEDVCDGGLCAAPRVAGCCVADADCDDGDACTQDVCLGGECAWAELDGCCAQDADCPPVPGACSLVTCQEGACVRGRVEGCCEAARDCDDDNPCTAERCADGACVFATVEGCCVQDADCDDGDPCTADACAANRCRSERDGSCCSSDGDCDDGDACTTDRCEDGACVASPTEGCCAQDADCEDGDVCTRDLCQGGACSHPRSEGCCVQDADCDDGDPCTDEVCDGQSCRRTEREGCCAQAEDCLDGASCDLYACEAGACVLLEARACCEADADCDDDDPCTEDACVDGACGRAPIEGCCQDAADCLDGDLCTQDVCLGNACVFDALPNCCASDEACNDGDPCTLDRCAQGQCAREPVCAPEDPDAGSPSVSGAGGGEGCASVRGGGAGGLLGLWLLGALLLRRGRR